MEIPPSKSRHFLSLMWKTIAATLVCVRSFICIRAMALLDALRVPRDGLLARFSFQLAQYLLSGRGNRGQICMCLAEYVATKEDSCVSLVSIFLVHASGDHMSHKDFCDSIFFLSISEVP